MELRRRAAELSRSRAGSGIAGGTQRDASAALPQRPGASHTRQDRHEGRTFGRRPSRLPAVAQADVRGTAYRARHGRLAVAGSASITNSYSVPVKYAHRKLTVVATVTEVRLVYQDRLVARHRRCWQKEQYLFEPVHYLALLERKPGGLDLRSTAGELAACRIAIAILRRRLGGAARRSGDARVHSCVATFRAVHTQATDRGGRIRFGLRRDRSRQHSLDRRAPSGGSHRAVSLDGRPHLAWVRIETTKASSYQALLEEASS